MGQAEQYPTNANEDGPPTKANRPHYPIQGDYMISQLVKSEAILLSALAYEGASDGAHGLMPQSSNPDYLKHWQEEFVRPRRRPDMFNRIIRTPAIATWTERFETRTDEH